MVIEREHEAQNIKSVMELPLTVQQQLSMLTGTLDEVHNFIDENNLLDKDVFVIPFITHATCTIGNFRHIIENSNIGIEVDNASNSILINDRIFTFVDITENSDGLTQLHFFELIKNKDNVGYTPDIDETLTITLGQDNTKIQTIQRRDYLVFVNLIQEQMNRRGA